LLRETSLTNSKFSFSKFQLWLWTLIICPIFCLHWGFNADTPNFEYINGTSLVLLAISGGVTLTSTVIKQAQLSASKTNSQYLSNNNLRELKAESTASKGFFADILSDDNGQFSIGRLQNFIFTMIYVVIYATYFFKHEKNYIDFGKDSSNVYLLMGISSTTYLIARGLFK
jgi:hypothetical protein